MANTEHPSHVKRELVITAPITRGDRGMKARRVQEWLTFHKFATAIDDDFGEATERRVRDFQQANNLPATGTVDGATWGSLIRPLEKALIPISHPANDSLSDLVLKYAKQHLAQHPIELGGDNLGPWVRVYMGGNEGSEWKWCAGFVCFIIKQAYNTLNRPMPIPGSFSCDSLAHQARNAGLFTKGTDIEAQRVSWSSLGTAQIFLVRRTPDDWTHTGISFGSQGNTFSTIEGNTNDEGSSNGFEACQRVRGIKDKDFIRFPE